MNNISEFSANDPCIGLTVRSTRIGPEIELVNEFLGQFKESASKLKRKYALFYEPLLPTGFPDIVVVAYNPRSYEKWNEKRSNINILDLKVLHHLYFSNGSNGDKIKNQLGINGNDLIGVLERLLDAKMIRRTKNSWIPISLKKNYAVSNIQAIEAKISDWKNVIKQAAMNHWFASESSILTPVKSPSKKIIEKIKKQGIGLISLPIGHQATILQEPLRSSLPTSYASWMLNEWIGRRLYAQ